MIPKIESKAYYPYLGDFTHTYDGQNYYFDFINESDIPNDIQIDSSIFDSVIQAELSMDSMRIAHEGYLISTSTNFVADLTSLLVNFALGTVNSTYQALIDENHNYLKWSVTYNGSVGTNRYSWTFSCPLGSQDIILGADGLLPHPSDHTYTSHDDQAIADILDDQVIDDEIYIPSGGYKSFHDLKAPYIEGKSLYFYTYLWGAAYKWQIPDFRDTYISVYYSDTGSRPRICFYSPSRQYQDSLTVVNLDNYQYYGQYGTTYWHIYYNGSYLSNQYYLEMNFNSYNDSSRNPASFVLPCTYNANTYNYVAFYNYSAVNCAGYYNQAAVLEQTPYIYLKSVSFDPVSNPDDIVIPQDEPLPIDPIITWPDDNLPDEDPDGTPTDVDPYDPQPINPVVPLPPIPSVVSGNDDLWPDLNDYFDTEDNIIDFTFPAVNVEFPDLSILLGNFVNSFTWVSTIITALFNGSDFSVLFSVLAFFFIAAAVLGIYKWWK